MDYKAQSDRYSSMPYNRCGNSGIKLPLISLGLWHNFGDIDSFTNGRDMILKAFDLGITHFDLANNYGPPTGTAEKNFGNILKTQLRQYRDEMIISTKAGYTMWEGPYGDWGSRKYLVSSLDQSLKRMQLEYVDIFYSHRADPETPLEETMQALHDIVKMGKALYVGLSNYNPEQTRKAVEILEQLGTRCLIHQPKYSMFERTPEKGLFDVLKEKGIGCIPFSPLAQGILTDRYLQGIPEDSRAARAFFLKPEQLANEKMEKVYQLKQLAIKRNQSIAQLALSWVLRKKTVTSVLIGASKVEQIIDCVNTTKNYKISEEEEIMIENILA